MRRLYSTFAGSWPGVGLLLMRAVVGSVLVACAGPPLWSVPPAHMTVGPALLAVAGMCLVAGLWTPVIGGLVAAVEIAQVLAVGAHPLVSVLSATIAAALAMLGPGRWSVDARLFGWKRVEIPLRPKNPDAI